MANEITNDVKANEKLLRMLNSASTIITKTYLERLESYDIAEPSEEDVDTDIALCGSFYKLTKLIHNSQENFLDKLTTVVNVISSIGCSFATVIQSDGSKINYYLGIVSKNVKGQSEQAMRRREADKVAFKGALSGNLVGAELCELSVDEVNILKKTVLVNEKNCYSAVSGVVALRDNENKSVEGYVQGIENLVDSLKGQKYTIVMLANPLKTSDIQGMKQGYEMLYTQLSGFARSTMTTNESDTVSMSRARTEGVSEGLSKGISMTQSKTQSSGSYFGGSAGVGFGLGIQLNVGVNAGMNRSTSDTTGKTDSTTETSQRSKAITDTTSSSKTEGTSLQLSFENRTIKSLLDKIDKYLERLDECDNFGAFDCAAYVIADNKETSYAVASNYNALMRGKESGIQASHINSWHKAEDTKRIGKYIGSLVHPRFWQDRDEKILVSPASVMSGEELAIQVGLPKKSVNGMTVISMAPFGRNVTEKASDGVVLGNLYHMGRDEGTSAKEQKVVIDVESLAMHTFITGSTGAGKSTVIYSMLDELMKRKIKGQTKEITFLVVEPAKGEYKNRFGNYPNVKVYGTNFKKTPMLRINPFSFPEDTHVLEHIDRLVEIFNVCWPMYAAMPAVLKDAIEKAYVVAGWNLGISECRYKDKNGKPLFPAFADVLRQINVVMEESMYSSDSKGDYKGALCTRLKSLTNGLNGQIFTNDELSAEELFDSNVIVDLSRIGSDETKALIMGLLVMKLQEYRMANAEGGNSSLRHVTVLEEAHNILKRTSIEQSGDSANVLGKAVQMISNSIAEMRTYGEGFIIADQAPELMDMSAIRNTNTKIILRIPDLGDRELVGRAACLNEEQILELSRLKTFVAAVYQNDWLEPVLCNITPNFKPVSLYRYNGSCNEDADKMRFLEYLLLPPEMREKLDQNYVEQLVTDVYALPISAEARIAFAEYTKAVEKEEVQSLRGKAIYALFNSETAFHLVKEKEADVEAWYSDFKEVLEPAITFLMEEEQKKVIAALTLERVQQNNTESTRAMFERLMDFI